MTPRKSKAPRKKASKRRTTPGGKKMGRPTKRTPQVVELLERCLRVGLDYRTASDFVGIDESTLRRWRDADPELCATLKKALAEAKVAMSSKLVNAIRTASPAQLLRHPTLLIFWLKTRTEEYREKQIVEVGEYDYEPDEGFL